MKIIITGGTGLIGRALAEDLAKDHNEVIILSRGSKPAMGFPPGVRLEIWDGRTAQGWGKLADGADAIVNLAGENISAGRWTPRRKQAIVESRANAGKAVVEAVQQAVQKPGVVIQISGVGAYGTSLTAVFFDENSSYGNDFGASVTRIWEAGTQPVEELGVRRVVARTGVVLTTKGGALPLMLLPFKFFIGGPLGSGLQWLSWVHLEDEVRALRFLIENPEARGIYNISAEPLSNLEFGKTIGKTMGRPAIFPTPAFIIRLMFGEMSTVVLDGQRVSARRLERLGFRFRFPDAETALKNLLMRS